MDFFEAIILPEDAIPNGAVVRGHDADVVNEAIDTYIDWDLYVHGG